MSNKSSVNFLAIDFSINGYPILQFGSRVMMFQYGLGGKCRFTLLYNKSIRVGVPDRISQTMNRFVNTLCRDNDMRL